MTAPSDVNNAVLIYSGWIITAMSVLLPLSLFADGARRSLNTFCGENIVGPKNALHFVVVYYSALFILTIFTMVVRWSLATAFPNTAYFQRPSNTCGNSMVDVIGFAKPFFVGGFPSGHAAAVAFFGGTLFFLAPGVGTAMLAVVLVTIVAAYRIRIGCHTVDQTVVGATIGVIAAKITSLWLVK